MVDTHPTRFVAVQIDRLYNNMIHDTFPLDGWWNLAPELAPQDLTSMSNLHIALLGIVSLIGAFVYGKGRNLAIRLCDVERRRQDREWETHPDD